MAAALFLGLALSVSGRPAGEVQTQPLTLEDPRILEVVRTRGRLSFHEAHRWAVVIEREAKKNRLPPSLVLGVIAVESSFRPRARSGAGAVGLMQVMPGTGREIARRLDIEWRGVRTLEDPLVNIEMGAHYLRRLIDYFGGRRTLALASYCHGPGVIRRYLKHGSVPQRRLRYAFKVRRSERGILRALARMTPEELAML